MPGTKKERQLKPMLAATAEALDGQAPEGITYPVMVSPKLDGIRALKVNGVLVSRTLKSIPSQHAHVISQLLPNGIDGELIVGAPNEDPYTRTVSAVMRRDSDTEAMSYYIFDNYLIDGGFQKRFQAIKELEGRAPNGAHAVHVVPHSIARNAEELLSMEVDALERGFEGVMIRSLDGPYKYGRSTVKEGYLLKLKRFKDAEAVVTGTYERLHNANEAMTDNLGHTERSSKKDGMEPTGLLGGFYVKGTNGEYTGIDFKVSSSTIPLIHLAEMWRQRRSYEGRLLTYKYFPTGSVERPRFPTFKGWRNPLDV